MPSHAGLRKKTFSRDGSASVSVHLLNITFFLTTSEVIFKNNVQVSQCWSSPRDLIPGGTSTLGYDYPPGGYYFTTGVRVPPVLLPCQGTITPHTQEGTSTLPGQQDYPPVPLP